MIILIDLESTQTKLSSDYSLNMCVMSIFERSVTCSIFLEIVLTY